MHVGARAHLGSELRGFLGRVVFGVGSDEATLELLHRHVLDVEADIVTRLSLWQRLVVHLHGLDFSGQARRSERDHHTGLQHSTATSITKKSPGSDSKQGEG